MGNSSNKRLNKQTPNSIPTIPTEHSYMNANSKNQDFSHIKPQENLKDELCKSAEDYLKQDKDNTTNDVNEHVERIKKIVDNGTKLKTCAKKGKTYYKYHGEVTYKYRTSTDRIAKRIVKTLNGYGDLKYKVKYTVSYIDGFDIIISWKRE